MKNSIKFMFVMLLSIALLFNSNIQAQEEEETSPISIGADLVSRYIWRGINLGGNAPSIQPSIEFALGKTGLSIGAWGAYSLGEITGQEADLYLSYTLPNELLSFTITDYFFPSDEGGYDYFDYDKDNTGHLFEAMISFNGTERMPISVMFALNIAGDDAKDEKGNNVLSKYIEVGYSKTIGSYDLSFFVGTALNNGVKVDGVKTPGFYRQTDAGVINLGLTASKEIAITDKFSLPVSASLITNPDSKSIYMVFGMSF